jgi:TonB family protein
MRRFLILSVLVASPCVLASQPVSGRKPLHIICTNPKAEIQKMVRPAFPAEAKQKGIFGRVLVEMTIDKEGRPKAIRASEGNPILREAVLRALPQWRWKPYKLNGQAVEVQTTITVNFEPGRP